MLYDQFDLSARSNLELDTSWLFGLENTKSRTKSIVTVKTKIKRADIVSLEQQNRVIDFFEFAKVTINFRF